MVEFCQITILQFESEMESKIFHYKIGIYIVDDKRAGKFFRPDRFPIIIELFSHGIWKKYPFMLQGANLKGLCALFKIVSDH